MRVHRLLVAPSSPADPLCPVVVLALLAFLLTLGAVQAVPGPLYGDMVSLDSRVPYCQTETSQFSSTRPSPYLPIDTLELILIGWAPGEAGGELIAGETDQDSLWELLGVYAHYCRIWENDGHDDYTLQQTLPLEYLVPWDTGDVDGDRLRDIVALGDNSIQVWESSAAHSHPSQLVWQSWYMAGSDHVRIVDLDQDGKQEILVARYSGVHIFECCGDNTFGWIFYGDLGGSYLGEFAVGDFDEDGWMEFAVGDMDGAVYVYECMGDDDFRRVVTLSTGVAHSFYATEARDMDGNGRWEFVVGGSPSSGGYKWTIFESVGNDAYTVVDSIWIFNGYCGQARCDAGDVDGDGVEELVTRNALDMRVFKAIDIGTYVQVAQYPEPDWSLIKVLAEDLNCNGYAEIVWVAYATHRTLILEDRRAYGQFELDVNASATIIPQGGTLSLDGMLVNLETTPETVDVWTEVLLPGGEPFAGNPAVGPVRVTLAPNDTLLAHPSHHIPPAAPLGEYTYMGFVSSSYPLPILAADTLTFTVVQP